MCEKNIQLTFAGQAGFILETSGGYRAGVDLYLSDCCARHRGDTPPVSDPQPLLVFF